MFVDSLVVNQFRMMDRLAITDDILINLPPQIKKRGLDLYNAGYVDLVGEDELNGDYEFEVKGNAYPHYDVNIVLHGEFDEYDVFCDCTYHEQYLQFCKHIAAALFFLKVFFGAKEHQAKQTRQRQPIKISVPDSKAPDPSILLSYTDYPSRDSLVPIRVYLFPDQLVANVKSGWEYLRKQKTVQVSLTWKKNAYYMECSDGSHKSNCEHTQWLSELVVSFKKDNLLMALRKEAYDKNVAEFFSHYNLALQQNERVEDVLDVVVSDDIVLVPKGRLKGLLPVDNIGAYLRDQVLAPFSSEELRQALILPTSVQEDHSTIPAFVWALDPDEEVVEDVYAVHGKPNKARNKLTSHLKRLDSPYEDSMISSEGFEKAFFLAKKVSALLSQEDTKLSNRFLAVTELAGQVKHQVNYLYFVKSSRFSYRSSELKKSELVFLYDIVLGVQLKFRFFEENDLFTLKAYLETPTGEILDIHNDKISVFDQFTLVDRNRLLFMRSLKEAMALTGFIAQPEFRTTVTSLDDFWDKVVHPIAEEFPVDFENIKMEQSNLEPLQKRLYISELNQFVMLRPVMLYDGNREVDVMEGRTILEKEGNSHRHHERDQEAEAALIQEIADLHPNFKSNTPQSYFFLSYDQFQKGFWFLKAFELLKSKDIHVFGLNNLKSLKFSPHPASVSIGYKSNVDWFETDIQVAFGDNQVKLKDVRRAVEEGNGYVELSDGTLGILPEEWLKKFDKIFRAAEIKKDSARISKTQFNVLDDLVEENSSPDVFKEIAEKKAKLSEFEGITNVAKPAILQANLRDYQQAGLNWLNFLREYQWGGILADDMGLGKTLQALALICLELEQNPDKPNLVIAPTTLLFNWKNEIEKFAPGLDYFVHHGQRYEAHDELKKHQLVLTSYGIAVNDVSLLKKIDFNLIIADESQAIKNLNSKRHKALAQLKGRVRIAMSGTPIENNIYELYAQMNFANPGFFQGLTAFKQSYGQAVERNNNELIISELRRKIQPFILRRTKEQVLTELPDKTEEYLYCEMSTAQRKVYDAFRNEYRDYLLEKFEEEGLEKSQMYVLEGLTRLRQVCDSPQLVEREGLKEKNSAKIDELVRHVMEKTGKHKILIFSQFVKMLQLIKEKFEELEISYEYLDGQTSVKEREKRVTHFQEDESCRVFLISLKAGGTGLNLTSADYVYIVDPWWNPAVENQAIDRCYRMGQQKKVFAYRMICKDTVEEKIIRLQDQKKALSDDIVGGEGMMKSLSREDIEALFS